MTQTSTTLRPKGKAAEIKTVFWIALVCIYVVVRFFFTKWLDSLGQYASYIFEGADVTIAAILAGHSLLSRFRPSKLIAIGMLVSLAGGFAIYQIARLSGIGIPFDLKGIETLSFLLIVAPILEELLFRFFIWEPLEWLFKTPIYAWIATTLIFSYSHFHAIWFIPREIYPFVIYQTLYTFGLGLACGFFVMKFRSFLGAITIHFAFNLGFYLASLA